MTKATAKRHSSRLATVASGSKSKKPKLEAVELELPGAITDFVRRMFNFSDPGQISRFNFFNKLPVQSARSIDWEVLGMIGLEDEVKKRVENLGLMKFVEIDDPAYPELTIQFISSFKVVSSTDGDEDFFSYKVLSRSSDDTLGDFNVNCGFIDEKELKSPGYLSALTDKHPRFDPAAFWEKIANDTKPFEAGKSKSINIHVPALKYLHRYIAFSLLGRKSNAAPISNGDLFLLWCSEEGFRVNVGWWFANSLSGTFSKDSALLFGTVVTRIAKNLSAFKPAVHESEMSAPIFRTPFDLNMCSRIGLYYVDEATGEYVLMRDCSAQAWDEKKMAETRAAKKPVSRPESVPRQFSPMRFEATDESGPSKVEMWRNMTLEQIGEQFMNMQEQIAHLSAQVAKLNMVAFEQSQPVNREAPTKPATSDAKSQSDPTSPLAEDVKEDAPEDPVFHSAKAALFQSDPTTGTSKPAQSPVPSLNTTFEQETTPVKPIQDPSNEEDPNATA